MLRTIPTLPMKNHYVFHQNRWSNATFNDNSYVKMHKTQKSWKSIGFIVFSSANVSKMNVLSTLRSKTLINCGKFYDFCKKCGTFTENPCAKTQKTQKSEKTIMFYSENCKIEQFCFIFLAFFVFLTREPREPGFYWDFRFCGMWGCFLIVC